MPGTLQVEISAVKKQLGMARAIECQRAIRKCGLPLRGLNQLVNVVVMPGDPLALLA
jgi:hypothetical protein